MSAGLKVILLKMAYLYWKVRKFTILPSNLQIINFFCENQILTICKQNWEINKLSGALLTREEVSNAHANSRLLSVFVCLQNKKSNHRHRVKLQDFYLWFLLKIENWIAIERMKIKIGCVKIQKKSTISMLWWVF